MTTAPTLSLHDLTVMLNTAQKVALAGLASKAVRFGRQLAGQGSEVLAVRQGLTWQLDLREGIDFSIYLLGSFEPATVRCYQRLVGAGDVVLDIGANVGAHALPLASLVGSAGRVIAFEPTAFAFAKLLANIRLNPSLAPRIVPAQTMLVRDVSVEMMDAIYSSWPLDPVDDVHAEHRGRLMPTRGARAATLDAMLVELKVDRVNFVKLDVDGNEYSVLLGARDTLRRLKPVILMELAPYVYSSNPLEFDALLDYLWGAGYQLRRVENGRQLPRDATSIRAMIPRAGGINVLATA